MIKEWLEKQTWFIKRVERRKERDKKTYEKRLEARNIGMEAANEIHQRDVTEAIRLTKNMSETWCAPSGKNCVPENCIHFQPAVVFPADVFPVSSDKITAFGDTEWEPINRELVPPRCKLWSEES